MPAHCYRSAVLFVFFVLFISFVLSVLFISFVLFGFVRFVCFVLLVGFVGFVCFVCFVLSVLFVLFCLSWLFVSSVLFGTACRASMERRHSGRFADPSTSLHRCQLVSYDGTRFSMSCSL